MTWPPACPKDSSRRPSAGQTFRIERIVSLGHASPEGFWYDQKEHEGVLPLAGAARLRFEDETSIDLTPGRFEDIPAHRRHQAEWTDTDRPTVWLAVH
jgi:cupin 2 domain-containing protein